MCKHQAVPPSSCFPGALKEAVRLRPAHSGKVQPLGEGSGCSSGAGRGVLLPPLACEKEYGSGKVPWKWFSITASGDGGEGRGQGPAELWQECPLRNSLFLPAAPTSPLGSEAHTAPLLQGSCVLSPTKNTAPSAGGNGRKRKCMGPGIQMLPGELRRGQGCSHCSQRCGQRSCKAPMGHVRGSWHS